jgi:hypothetical protein
VGVFESVEVVIGPKVYEKERRRFLGLYGSRARGVAVAKFPWGQRGKKN